MDKNERQAYVQAYVQAIRSRYRRATCQAKSI